MASDPGLKLYKQIQKLRTTTAIGLLQSKTELKLKQYKLLQLTDCSSQATPLTNIDRSKPRSKNMFEY